MRVGHLVFALAIVLGSAPRAHAEWQIKPFLGVTFGGGTTVLDLEQAVGKPNVALGANVGIVGEVFGIEADFGYGPGFFQTGSKTLVLDSSVSTLTGNVIIAVPRRLTEYTLRPYFVGGAGLLHAATTNASSVLELSRNFTAIDLGGGVTGFFTRRLGVNWDVRHFRSIRSSAPPTGLSIGDERLSFWRASMALAIRY
jgi:hypothetical protein